MTNEQYESLREDIRELSATTRDGFALMNGRVRTNERDIAVLQDRSNREKGTASKWGGVTGSLGGLIGGILAGWMGGGK